MRRVRRNRIDGHGGEIERLALQGAFQSINAEHNGPLEFHCGDHEVTAFTPGAIVMITITGLLFCLCCLAELVEIWERRKLSRSAIMSSVNAQGSSPYGRESKPLLRSGGGDGRAKPWSASRKLLKSFCPSDALSELFEPSQKRQVAALDGLRSFSMLWIVFAHTSVLSIELGTDDQHAVQLTEQSIPQQFTLGASLAIDTFFFLSGTRPEPFNFTPMGANPISPGPPHVRPMGVRTCVSQTKSRKIPTRNIVPLFFASRPPHHVLAASVDAQDGHQLVRAAHLRHAPLHPPHAPVRREPFNFTPMAVNSISSGSPRVRPMGRTCGEPDEIKKNAHPKYFTALFRAGTPTSCSSTPTSSPCLAPAPSGTA